MSASPDEWPVGSAAIAMFVLLVAGLLGIVLAWLMPYLVWAVVAAIVLAVLSLHALARAALAAWRRRWRAALAATGLGVLFALAIAALPVLGWRVPDDSTPAFDDARS